MATQLQPIKGFRDLYPSEKAVQNYVFDTLKAVADLYGFENIDGPILEPIELYANKSSQELVEEQTFKVNDKNDQTLVMRPEWTPSLARMVANKANELIFPLKTFNLGLRYRYEAPQKGRSREFYQADYDILGTNSIVADAEILAVVVQIFTSLGATEKDFVVSINSRTFIDTQLSLLKIENIKAVRTIIDRRDKMPAEKFDELLNNANLSKEQIKKLKTVLDSDEVANNDPYFKELTSLLKSYKIDKYIKIDTNIVRGLDYYTGLVFEVKEIGEMKRSLLGGGRYDNLVSSYNDKLQIQGVGFATSDVSLLEFIKDKELVPKLNPKPTQYLVTIFSEETVNASISVTNMLRESNISVELYPDAGKKLDKQIKYADRNNIPYVVVIGPEEVEKKIVKIKNMATGSQDEISLGELSNLNRGGCCGGGCC